MSDALFSTRLRWAYGKGIAKLHGRIVVLDGPPVIGGVAVHCIDYTPEVHCHEIVRRACDPRDDMTVSEIREADAFLRLLFSH